MYMYKLYNLKFMYKHNVISYKNMYSLMQYIIITLSYSARFNVKLVVLVSLLGVSFPGFKKAPSSSGQNLHSLLGLRGDDRAGSTFMPFKVVIRSSLPGGKRA